MSTFQKKQRKRGKTSFFIFLLMLSVIGGVSTYLLFFENTGPSLTLSEPQDYIGSKAVVSFRAEDKESGLRSVLVTITQGEKSVELYHKQFSRKGYTGMIGEPVLEQRIPFSPEKSDFKDGPAILEITATDFSAKNILSGNRHTLTKELTIDTTAPKINIIHSERYINPGGSGIVIYRLSDPSSKNGLLVNGQFNQGFPAGDGRDDVFIAFFGLPYDTKTFKQSVVIAEDQAGNKKTVPFATTLTAKKFKNDRIIVSDSFLNKKIPEIEQFQPEIKGEDNISKYLFTNNEIRRKNNERIKGLCATSHPERLWSGRFSRMAGSVQAGFADHRTYFYHSRPIDKQVHLGIDIASTQNADVKASAKGVVVFADYLGIYGNLVMLDHGQGLFSLYSHLSQINVSVEDTIEKGIVIGRTGTSGMAGGDHLHFSVLVNGIFVNPREWWDQHWIDVTLEEPLTESRFQ